MVLALASRACLAQQEPHRLPTPVFRRVVQGRRAVPVHAPDAAAAAALAEHLPTHGRGLQQDRAVHRFEGPHLQRRRVAQRRRHMQRRRTVLVLRQRVFFLHGVQERP